MASKSRKLVTTLTVTLGIGVLVATGIAFKDPIIERWYTWKFQQAETEDEKWELAEKLTKFGSEVAEDWYLKKWQSGNSHFFKWQSAKKNLRDIESFSGNT